MTIIQDFRVRKGIVVSENATVVGNVAISQQLSVTNSVSLANTLSVTGTSLLTGNTTISGFANIGNTLQVSGNGSFGTGNVTFDTDTLVVDAFNDRVSINAASSTVALFVQGDANVAGTFTANNINFTNIVGTTLNVGTGNSIFDSGVLFVDAINNRVGVNNTTPDASLTVTGTANVSGAVRIAGTLTTALAGFFSNTLSVAGNATFSNTVAITGATTLASTLNVTGILTANIVNTGSITATAIASGGGVTLTGGSFIGPLIGVANQCGRSVINGSYMLGGSVLTNDITLSVDATPNNTVNKVVARDASGNFSANIISASVSGVSTGANTLLYAGGYRSATDAATGSTIMARDANGDTFARFFRGTATSSLYADLAEKYLADDFYISGTVIAVGGEKEVTAATVATQHSILGVVSTAPAHLMNDGLIDGTAIALKGRVPVRVVGTVQKGDRLTISELPGIATAHSCNEWTFAIALESSVDPEIKIVEAVIL